MDDKSFPSVSPTPEQILAQYADHFRASGPGGENRLRISFNNSPKQPIGYIVWVERREFVGFGLQSSQGNLCWLLKPERITRIEHSTKDWRTRFGTLYEREKAA